jgi:phospholipid/cholesterol/gamma-HCH transport system permease protein
MVANWRDLMKLVAAVGDYVLDRWKNGCYIAAVLSTALWEATRPSSWTAPVRRALGRQLHHLGVESVWLTALVATMLGLVVVVLSRLWEAGAMRPQLLNPLLVLLVARELGPIFTNVIVMARNGSATTTELAILQVSGGVDLLERQGRDPFLNLVMPRVLGAALAVLCLTIIFIGVSFAASYLVGTMLNYVLVNPEQYLDSLLELMSPEIMLVIVTKSALPALLFGAICSTQGLAVRNLDQLPWATRRAMMRSLTLLFIISAVVPLVVYI